MDNNIFLNIPRLLRCLGVLAIGSSATLALVQGVTSPISELTILSFLGFIVALLVVGIFSGTLLNEAKGGRVSVGLALTLVPPFFALLGALLIQGIEYSTYWKIVPSISLGTSVILTIISSLVVIPTVLLGFRVLHNEHHSMISGLHLFSASVLLIPIRELNVMGFLFALTCALAILVNNLRSGDTLEEKFAKLILWVTPVVLAIRTIGGYPSEHLSNGIILIIGSIFLSSLVRALSDDKLLIKPLEDLTGLVGAFGAYLVADGLLPDNSLLIVFGNFVGVMIIGLSQLFTYEKRNLENLGFGVMVFTALLSPFSKEIILSCTVSLALSVGFILLSITRRSKYLLGGGVAVFLVSVLGILSTVVTNVNLSSWIILGIIGLTVIIISSIIERKLPTIRTRFIKGYEEINTW